MPDISNSSSHTRPRLSSRSGVGSLASTRPLACRHSPSTGFSSGQAVGRNRSSTPSSAASRRDASAVCGVPRSRNRTMFHPRHTARTFRRWSWNVCWFHPGPRPATASRCAGLSAPKTTFRSRFPVIGTSACSPTGDQHARSGGVSVRMVASENSTTVRSRPVSPRWSPLLPAASARPGGTGRTGAASTGTRAGAAPGGRSCRTPRPPAGGGGPAAAGWSRPGAGTRGRSGRVGISSARASSTASRVSGGRPVRSASRSRSARGRSVSPHRAAHSYTVERLTRYRSATRVGGSPASRSSRASARRVSRASGLCRAVSARVSRSRAVSRSATMDVPPSRNIGRERAPGNISRPT